MPTFNFNKIIKLLIISDFFVYSSWGLIMPVLAVFIVGNIKGGDVSVAGMAVGIYWVAKSLFQVPIGKLLDKIQGEKDDYWFMIAGTFIASLTPLIFLISTEPWHIYGLQVLHAFGMAMVVPAWAGIFTRHIDRGREAETWGFESSLLGLGVGGAGIAGGFIAKLVGFAPLFIGISAFGLLGVLLLLLVKKDILRSRMGIKHKRHGQELRHVGHARYKHTKKAGHIR